MFSAFGDLASVIQGGRKDEDEEEGEEIETAEDGEEEGAEGSEKAVPAGEKLSLWGMASALRETVKKRTAELAASIQETDWRAELDALKEELVEVKEDTVELGQRTRAAVAQLPGVVEQWKGEGGLGAKAEGAGTALQAKAKEAQEQVLQASKKLGLFGTRVLHGTSELFDQIKDAIQAEMAFDEPPTSQRHAPSRRQLAAGSNVKFSRFEADVSAMQRDSSTYCDEPEDEEDYAAWLAGFDLAGRRSDIDALVASNTFMAELQARIVPLIVEYDAFWTRYFYRLHKLQQKHEQFVQLTQRANNTEEEDLGWGSDEEEQQAGDSNPASPIQQQQQQEEEVEETEEEAAVGKVGKGEEDASQADAAALPDDPKEAATAAQAPSSSPAAAAAVTVASSPASPRSETVSIHSDISQVSGGTQESWQVVSSPRAADQKANKGDAAAALTTAGEAAANPGAGKKEGSASGAGAAAGGDKGAEKGGSNVAAGAAAGLAAAAVTAATPAAPAKPEAATEDKAAAGSKKEKDGEESELSDFDVDDDAPALGEAVDEDWGDDWE